jgi:hypothetical protein
MIALLFVIYFVNSIHYCSLNTYQTQYERRINVQCSHELHVDISVNERLYTQSWSHEIILPIVAIDVSTHSENLHGDKKPPNNVFLTCPHT